MVSDGTQARIGTLTAGTEWFKPWRTVTGETVADAQMTELQVMLEGICDLSRFLGLVRDFIVFEDNGSGAPVKKIAGYHQFHAVRVAVEETLRAADRLKLVAQDIVDHYEQRLEALDGKAMVVCMSRPHLHRPLRGAGEAPPRVALGR